LIQKINSVVSHSVVLYKYIKIIMGGNCTTNTENEDFSKSPSDNSSNMKKLKEGDVDCSGLSPECVFAEMYNKISPIGMGLLQYDDIIMTEDVAKEILKECNPFGHDYVKGRPMKTNFTNFPILNSKTYEKNNSVKLEDIIKDLKNNITTKNPPREMPSNDEKENMFKKCNDQIKITSMPNGNSVNSLKNDKKPLEMFSQVNFIKSFCEELDKQNMPYPNDWCMFVGIKDDLATFVGSMGGRFEIDINSRIIKSVLK